MAGRFVVLGSCGFKHWLPSGLVLVAGLLAAGRAHGQVASTGAQPQLLDQFISPGIAGTANQPGVTVQSRQRPEYDSAGVRVGSFILRSSVTEGTGFESNVLGTSSQRGSALVQTHAELTADSDVSRAAVSAGISVDDTRYLQQQSQSFTNWIARLGGSYDVGRDVAAAQFTHLNLSQTTRDLDVAQTLSQTLAVRIDIGRFTYRKNFNRVFVTPMLEVSNYAFDNGTLASGAAYQQDYRNRVLLSPSVTAGYEFSPRRDAVLVVRDNQALYSRAPSGLPRRNYTDVSLLAGIDYDVTGLFRVRALAGYELRSFDASTYKTIEAPVAELSVVYAPTGLTTLTGTVARHIQDSADETTAGYTETSVGLQVDHEYRRDVLLRATGGFIRDDYRNSGSQSLYTVGTAVTYLANRNLSATLGYDFAVRDSSNSNGTNLGNTQTVVDQVALAGGLGTGNGLGTGSSLLGQGFGSGYRDHRIMFQVRLKL